MQVKSRGMLAAAVLLCGGVAWHHFATLPSVPEPQVTALTPPAPLAIPSTTASSVSPELPLISDTAVPDGLELTTTNHLQKNKGIHLVFDYFLLGGLRGDRDQHIIMLQHYLAQKLPEPARAEALQLLQDYLSYLRQHDELLEKYGGQIQMLNGHVQTDKMRSWISQRSRLRQTILGIELANLWFGDEDAAELRALDPDSARSNISQLNAIQHANEVLSTMRTQSATVEQQRAYFASQFGEAAAQRFEASLRAENAWQDRVKAVQQSVQQIRQQGLNESDTQAQITALIQQNFLTPSEQIRARSQLK